MKRAAVLILVLLFALPATAQEVVEEFSWSKLKAEGRLRSGTIVSAEKDGGFESLVVENRKNTPVVLHILTIDAQKITASSYVLLGEVEYENVEGTGYLEMWNHFPDGSAFFSRTLESGGSLKSLQGTSDWRPFSLPFYLVTDPRRPSKLVFNVCLPGKGRVALAKVQLVQNVAGPLPPMGWWTGRDAVFILGIVVGIMVALGCVSYELYRNGKAHRFILWELRVLGSCGGLCCIFMFVAMWRSQPEYVWTTLMVIGLMLTILPGLLFRAVRKRYEELELRKMEALDKS